jgi:hypothetical protein
MPLRWPQLPNEASEGSCVDSVLMTVHPLHKEGVGMEGIVEVTQANLVVVF